MAVKAKSKAESQSCQAWLTIGAKTCDGRTGRDQGHAEMSALHGFVTSFDSVDQAVAFFNQQTNRVVYCPSRPVCKQCGFVLRRLGFACGTNSAGTTVWGDKTMGSTEWGCTLKVRDFLKKMGVSYDEAVGLRK